MATAKQRRRKYARRSYHQKVVAQRNQLALFPSEQERAEAAVMGKRVEERKAVAEL